MFRHNKFARSGTRRKLVELTIRDFDIPLYLRRGLTDMFSCGYQVRGVAVTAGEQLCVQDADSVCASKNGCSAQNSVWEDWGGQERTTSERRGVRLSASVSRKNLAQADAVERDAHVVHKELTSKRYTRSLFGKRTVYNA